MKKNLLIILTLLTTASFYANAGWFSEKKDELREQGKKEIKIKLTETLDKNCFKLPIVNYYLCPPISPDFIDNY